MYKLITIDLDGTLLNRYGEVTEYTKNIIKQVTQKGILVVLASGRISESVLTIAKEIGANKYYISGNGSVLYDMQKNEILYENYLNKEKVLEIIELCEKNSIYYNIYTESSVIAKSLNYNVAFYNYENTTIYIIPTIESESTETNINQENHPEEIENTNINSESTNIIEYSLPNTILNFFDDFISSTIHNCNINQFTDFEIQILPEVESNTKAEEENISTKDIKDISKDDTNQYNLSYGIPGSETLIATEKPRM